jgi:hypothetical protein
VPPDLKALARFGHEREKAKPAERRHFASKHNNQLWKGEQGLHTQVENTLESEGCNSS